MRRLIFISLALSIPVIIWWIEKLIAKKNGKELKGPSISVLVGMVVGILFILVTLLLTQTSNAPEGSTYSPAKLVNGEVVPGSFNN